MAKKKIQSKPLEDYGAVAHVVPAPEGTTRQDENGKPIKILSFYINKYGRDIGGLCVFENGQVLSVDYNVWQEFIADNKHPTIPVKTKPKVIGRMISGAV